MQFDNKTNTRLDFNDILIQPATTTNINSRREVNPFDSNGMLPIFTAPMDTVVDKNNITKFFNNKINVCFPRQKEYYRSGMFHYFTSISLDDFIKTYLNNDISFAISNKDYVLIDIANGHMKKMTDAISQAKEKYGDKLFIMAGNVANPDTFLELGKAGADAVRIGIGNGNGCFLDGTKVLTNKGYKNIEDIEIGEYVLTHLKEFKEVIGKTRYSSDEQIYKINNIECTENHEFYVVNKVDIDLINDDNYPNYAFWIEAKNIDEEKHLLLEIE